MKKRPCRVEISTGSLEDNYRVLVAASGGPNVLELLAIVKANAYGHGLELCAPAAVRAGARWLGVTSVEEGVAARALAPEAEILVIGGIFAGQGEAAVAHRLTAVVWEQGQIAEIEAAATAAGCGPGSIPVHLELDTGMSRQGIGAAELSMFAAKFAPGSGSVLRLDGVMTHLYAADESDGLATREQFAVLEKMLEAIHDSGVRPQWLHMGNSAAVMAGEVAQELARLCGRFGLKAMARPGLALYGIAPEFSPEEAEAVVALRGQLQRVLEWKTQVVSLRTIETGQTVGYNATFIASEPMRLALLAAGYADGLKRALSNRGWVLIGGMRAPIVGRISMDQTIVDVTEIDGVEVGDEVVLIGRQGSEQITAEEHAQWAGTIPWEILTSIACRVERTELRVQATSGQGS
jgi:alanine racemase